jgi:hypothetical protein
VCISIDGGVTVVGLFDGACRSINKCVSFFGDDPLDDLKLRDVVEDVR